MHPDGLFTIEQIPPALSRDESLYAVIEPARRVGVSWQPEAAELVVEATLGYPAHLQLFADETWHVARGPDVITLAEARAGKASAEQRSSRQSLSPRLSDLRVGSWSTSDGDCRQRGRRRRTPWRPPPAAPRRTSHGCAPS